MFNKISSILFKLSAWYFQAKADGKIDADEWEKLLALILSSLEEEGVNVEWTPPDSFLSKPKVK